MGCIIGSIISSVACCCCSAAASLCCACLPSCKGSTSCRIMYMLFLVLGMAVAIAMLTETVGNLLKKISVLCKSFNETYGYNYMNYQYNCDYSVNLSGIYRCCFGISMFFFILSLVMIRVKSSIEVRGKIQNGFWFPKFIIFSAFIILSLIFLPDPYFTSTWVVFGMIGSFLFILIQLILIIDFAYAWNEDWVNKYEIEQSKKYYYGLVGFTLIFYIFSVAVVIFLVINFGSFGSCHLHRFFIIFNTILCIICIVVSVWPKVQEHNTRSGLLQSSCITLYILFLTWSSLRDSPNKICNPTLKSNILNSSYNIIKNNISENRNYIVAEMENYKLVWNVNLILSLILFFLCIAYFSIRSSVNEDFGDNMPPVESPIIADQEIPKSVLSEGGSKGYKGQVVIDDEKVNVSYDYSLFHFIYSIGSVYFQMTLTNWYGLYSDPSLLIINPATIWIKIASSWVCVTLYLWTLLAPVLFPDRDFN